jgi:ferrous iron transport protein A
MNERESLAALDVGITQEIALLEGSPDDVAMLDAIGVSPGRRVTVLRRAPFGGPIHVRIDTGIEVAIDQALASHIVLRSVGS